ncbi:hypothetical protein [Ornithinimicrobium kibberense]
MLHGVRVVAGGTGSGRRGVDRPVQRCRLACSEVSSGLARGRDR